MGAIEVITEIEEYFEMEFEDEEIGVDLLQTVDSLSNAVSRHYVEQETVSRQASN